MEIRWFLVIYICVGLMEIVSGSSWIDDDPWRRFPRQSSCKCSCGITRREQRIVGGKPTIVFAFPWMAGLLYKGNLYCGGALINDRYVITAAHCVDGVDPRQLQVLLGGHDLTKDDETEAVIRSLSGLVKHPQFVRKTFNNDIALLRLNEPISQFTRSVSPACLPSEDRSYSGENATVIGWGRLSENGPISPVLRQVTVPIYSDGACQSSKYGQRAITDNMMCAGYDNGKLDACQGDSGGPLHYDAADKKIDIIGVVSWGQGCGRAGYPGVYTRVGRYLSWISQHTQDACYCGRREGRTRSSSSDIWNG